MNIPLLNRVALGFASAGSAIAFALTVSHASKVPLPCGGGSGCEIVAQDPSSSLFGIPVSAFGLAAYVVLMVLAGLRVWIGEHSETKQTPPPLTDPLASPAPLREAGETSDDDQSRQRARLNLLAGALISTLGALASAWLTYYSISHIHATCAWCIGSALMMLGSVVTYGLMLAYRGSDQHSNTPALQHSRRAHPVTAIPWLVVPLLLISGIAIWGGKAKTAAPDLSSVRLDLVTYDEVLKSSHGLGSPTAPITIAEFGDLMCPACRDMHQRVLRFQGKYPTKVTLLFHNFPLGSEAGHELSIPAAEMSDRLSATDFWAFINQIYASETKPTRKDLDAIFATFRKPVNTETEAKQALKREVDLGQKYGVHQTPTYILFVNQKPSAVATSTNLAQVLSQQQFKEVMTGTP